MTKSIEPEPERISFDLFYRTEHLLVIRFVRSLGASWEEAWDVSQYCCVKALERWETISDPARWIRTTVMREYRRVRARRADELPRMLCGGWEPRPHFDKLDIRSEEARVYGIIASLPQRQAEVMALTYDGYKPKEIAEILTEVYPEDGGITADAVRASLHPLWLRKN
jgi:DNA-directed RNA polymerase specialized sigma24 family protein